MHGAEVDLSSQTSNPDNLSQELEAMIAVGQASHADDAMGLEVGVAAEGGDDMPASRFSDNE